MFHVPLVKAYVVFSFCVIYTSYEEKQTNNDLIFDKLNLLGSQNLIYQMISTLVGMGGIG